MPLTWRAGWLVASAAILLFALAAPFLAAKDKKKTDTRVVTGMVLDKSENPISGAAVVLTDRETGKKSATYTDKEGKYLFSDLKPTRNYEVQANHNGELSQVRRVSTIDPRNRIVLNLRIPPLEE